MTELFQQAAFENLEALLSNDREQVYHFISSRSPFSSLFRANVSPEMICRVSTKSSLPLFFNDRDILLEHPEILDQIAKSKRSLLLGNRSDAALEEATGGRQVPLIAVSSSLRKQFEDKCFFHEFLLRNGLPCPIGAVIDSESDFARDELYPGVVQVAESQSGSGTFFVQTPQEALKLCQQSGLIFPLLLRKFIHGIPFGVTVLCGREHVIVSALRRQCSLRIENREIFCGVQWIEKSDLSLSQAASLENALARLGSGLRAEGFTGVANVDLILSDEGPLFIECNPRLSGATWQLAQEPVLFHGLSFLSEYSSVFLGNGPSCTRLELPQSSFRGSTFDFDFLLLQERCKEFPRRGSLQAGVYQFCAEEITFLGEDLELLEVPRSFLLLPGAMQGELLSADCGVGIALSDFSLYRTQSNRAELNKFGRVLREKVAAELL